jgi:hypothetical protein
MKEKAQLINKNVTTSRNLGLSRDQLPANIRYDPKMARYFDLVYKGVAHYDGEDLKSARFVDRTTKDESYSGELDLARAQHKRSREISKRLGDLRNNF